MKRASLSSSVLVPAVITAITGIWWNASAAAQQASAPSQPVTADEVSRVPELPRTPSQNSGAQPIFVQWVELAKPYQSDFRAERPLVRAGWLAVVRADSALLAPRSLAEPLLLAAGDGWITSVEWIQHGHTSGHRVCFIPWVDDAQPSGSSELRGASESIKERANLRDLRIWFGTPELPERVDAAMLARERALAQASGLQPTPKDRVPAASADLSLTDRDALVARMKQLAATWCPAEIVEAEPDAKVEAQAPEGAR